MLITNNILHKHYQAVAIGTVTDVNNHYVIVKPPLPGLYGY